MSHETIYRTLFIQARGALKKELMAHLRKQRMMRQSRHTTLKGKGLGKITDTVSIDARGKKPLNSRDRSKPNQAPGGGQD